MKVLHINQSDISGGAALAGYRLHQGLLNQNIDSRLLVGTARTDDDRVSTFPRRLRLENQVSRFTRYLGLNYLNCVSSFEVQKDCVYQEADLLNFHNLHTGYFNYLAISSLTKRKPAVFTLHDMWSFTGHCAYSYDCERWKIGCGQCPDLNIYPSVSRDNTHLEWKLKDWTYKFSDLAIVTPSRWLTKQVKESMLNHFPIHFIPYGIDTEAYQPLEASQCRSLLDIPVRKRTLMFGAESLKDFRKGGDLLIKTLATLPESLKAEIILITLGNGGETIAKTLGIQTLNLGYIGSDRLKAIAYSAADLFIFPTRADNSPLVLQESMACGTPMISFKIGGVSDLVRPNITGYLAAPEDTQDLCNGVMQLLEDQNLRERMSQQCRVIACAEYSLELQAQRYIELYSQLLKSKSAIA